MLKSVINCGEDNQAVDKGRTGSRKTMSIRPISLKTEQKTLNNQNAKKNEVAFGNMGNPVITMMDAVGRGGYIAEFLVQDGCGFILPRVTTGLNRNREETGQLNWKFASTEAIREFLSGPSMVAIPMAILWGVRKKFGTANDIPIKHIAALSNNFSDFAKNQPGEILNESEKLKKAYYKNVMKNILSNASEGALTGDALDAKAESFTNRILDIEKTKDKSFIKKFTGVRVEGSKTDKLGDLHNEFIELRKQSSGSGGNPLNLHFSSVNEKGEVIKNEVEFKKFMTYLKDFTEDVSDNVSNKLKGSDVAEFVKKFKEKRVASRFALILGLDLAVAAFLCIVPKLYKHKDGNPGLAGLDITKNENEKNTKKETEVK